MKHPLTSSRYAGLGRRDPLEFRLNSGLEPGVHELHRWGAHGSDKGWLCAWLVAAGLHLLGLGKSPGLNSPCTRHAVAWSPWSTKARSIVEKGSWTLLLALPPATTTRHRQRLLVKATFSDLQLQLLRLLPCRSKIDEDPSLLEIWKVRQRRRKKHFA
jgi:hypothetical protein